MEEGPAGRDSTVSCVEVTGEGAALVDVWAVLECLLWDSLGLETSTLAARCGLTASILRSLYSKYSFSRFIAVQRMEVMRNRDQTHRIKCCDAEERFWILQVAIDTWVASDQVSADAKTQLRGDSHLVTRGAIFGELPEANCLLQPT